MASREEHDGKQIVARAVEGARPWFTPLTILGFLGILLTSIVVNQTMSDLAATLRIVAPGWVLAMLAARQVAKALGASMLRTASDLNGPANDNGGSVANKLGD